MTETRYTLGPWKLSRGNSDYAKIDGEGWSQLAAVVVRLSGDATDHPEGSANAHLIAAAPELYEALEELESIIDGLVLGHLDLSDIDSFTNQPARAALAKARGEQS